MNWLIGAQVVIGLILIVLILMQSQGGGLGATFGGMATYHTKRGIEKSLFVATIIMAVAFTLISILVLVI